MMPVYCDVKSLYHYYKPGNDVLLDWFDREETRSRYVHTYGIAKGVPITPKIFPLYPEQQRAAFDHDDDKELTA